MAHSKSLRRLFNDLSWAMVNIDTIENRISARHDLLLIPDTENREKLVRRLEEDKKAMDQDMAAIKKVLSKYKNVPVTLRLTFDAARKRKAAIKGQVTKLQNRLLRQGDFKKH